MKKSTILMYLIIFIVICIIPTPTYNLLGNYLDKENYEKRNSSEAPTLNLSTLNSYSKKYEEFFDDNVPFRTQLIKINSFINCFIFKQSPISKVIIGKEGWLYYNPAGTDGDPMADTMGTNLYTEEQMKQCAENLIKVREQLKLRGKDFYIMIAPNKASIYNEYLPKKYNISENTRADLLVSYLKKHTDINIVYPKEELINKKNILSDALIYYKTDTHWNNLGGYIGAKSLLSSLNIKIPELENVEISEIERNIGDLSNMMALTEYFDDKDYQIKGYSENSNVTSQILSKENSDIVKYNAENKDTRTLVLVHDSFSEAMIPYIKTQFNDFYSIHINSYSANYLNSIDYDVVVLEVVERYLDNLVSFKVQ